MKTSCIFALCLSFSSIAFAEEQPAAENAPQKALPVISATATLKDGSVVKGQFLTPEFTGNAIFAEGLKLDATLVKTIVFTKDSGEAKIELKNGDKFAMTITDEKFGLTSMLGELAIPRTNFKNISFSSLSYSKEAGLVFYSSLDSEAAITAPTVGNGGKIESGTFVPGKFGQALAINARTNGATFPIPAGTLGPAGCIECWARIPDDRTYLSDGGVPRLFTLRRMDHFSEFVIEWNGNNGSGGHGLTGRAAGAAAPTNDNRYDGKSAYGSVLKSDPTGWHHYALVWNQDGLGPENSPLTARVAVYVDGRCVSKAKSLSKEGLSFLHDNDSFLYLPKSTQTESGYQRARVELDEIKIWNYAKTEFNLLADPSVKTDSSISGLTASTSKASITAKTASGDDTGLVFSCSFEGKESIPGKINNAKFVDGKVGQALYVQRGLSACEINFPEGTIGPKGCIEFWASMLDGKTEFTTGGDPRFFTMHSSNGTEFGTMEYASNNGQANSGLWTQLPFGNAYSNTGFSQMMPYSDIFHGKPYEGWHHYAIVWNYDGISSKEANGRPIAIFVDGHVITPYAKIVNPRDTLKNFGLITNLAIPMRLSGPSYNNKSNFLIDELKIWNYDKTPEVED